MSELFNRMFPRTLFEEEPDITKKLLELERKLDRTIAVVERLEKWLEPRFDEEGNVIK